MDRHEYEENEKSTEIVLIAKIFRMLLSLKKLSGGGGEVREAWSGKKKMSIENNCSGFGQIPSRGEKFHF